MIVTREAHTDDEAWMIEKLNQDEADLDDFAPRDFLLVVNDETEQRLGFGRAEYVRNVDDTEYVEINSVLLTDIAELSHGKALLSGLVEKISQNQERQIFAFPHENQEMYEDVGFRIVEDDGFPQVMEDRYNDRLDEHGEDVVPMTAKSNSVDYEVEDDEEEFEKPEGQVNQEEVDRIKDELDIDEEASTKYEV